MAPSTPPSDTFVVNVDSEAYGDTLGNTTPSSSSSSDTLGSPFSGIESKAGISTAVATGPLAGLRRLFDRNPTKVINGRYTINFRQFLILLVIIFTVTVLWFISNGSTYSQDVRGAFNKVKEQERLNNGYDQDVRGVFNKVKEQERLNNGYYSNEKPESENNESVEEKESKIVAVEDTPVGDVARERYERVRGKGTKTSLKKIQFDFPEESEKNRELREKRRKLVRDGMAHAWAGYKMHAWGHDEVYPLSGGSKDNFNGWGATMIDSLDTLVIMGFNDEFDEALEWVKTKFDMTKNPTAQLQFFETVIRYLGGLLSAYDLTGEKVLLEKAEELGGYCLNAFGSSDFPNGRFAVQKSANYGGSSYILAEVGSIQLEFTRLSTLTGNPIYKDKALTIFDILGTADAQLPGLLPFHVQPNREARYNYYQASIAGMADSYYEYLLKEWILLDGEGKAPKYKAMFEEAADSVSKYMVTRPENGNENLAILGLVQSSSRSISTEMEHLGCFMGGSLAMGSKYFDRPSDMKLAMALTEACVLSYHMSETGLGPENIKFDAVAGSNGRKFVANPATFYNRGSSRGIYILRPETVESLWILYRLTGDKKYQDQAWQIFMALERNCRTDIAYASLKDVNKIGSHDNRMESFFLAETLKYLYLIFSPPNVISLDDFVLNTEAHPLRRM
ncbi:hypothetical protein BG000_008644 [Podila horticola]|nr:hypothetical protein BG000_008644 [Podila horticola]